MPCPNARQARLSHRAQLHAAAQKRHSAARSANANARNPRPPHAPPNHPGPPLRPPLRSPLSRYPPRRLRASASATPCAAPASTNTKWRAPSPSSSTNSATAKKRKTPAASKSSSSTSSKNAAATSTPRNPSAPPQPPPRKSSWFTTSRAQFARNLSSSNSTPHRAQRHPATHRHASPAPPQASRRQAMPQRQAPRLQTNPSRNPTQRQTHSSRRHCLGLSYRWPPAGAFDFRFLRCSAGILPALLHLQFSSTGNRACANESPHHVRASQAPNATSFFSLSSFPTVGARHAVPERATSTRAPSTHRALQCSAVASEFLHRDEWPDRAKFFHRARHAVPLLTSNQRRQRLLASRTHAPG